MSLILLILLPVFAIGLTIYIGSLITFVMTNEFNYLFIFIGMFVSILSGFFISKNISGLFSKKSKSLNIVNDLDIYYSYFTFILFFIFGVSFLANYIIRQNIYYLAIGMLAISFFIYITIMFFGYKEEKELKVKYIDTSLDKIYGLTLEDDEAEEFILYVDKDLNIHNGKIIKVNYNKFTKKIKRIKGD